MGSLAVKSRTRFFRYEVMSTPTPRQRPKGPHDPFGILQAIDEAADESTTIIVECYGFLNSIALRHIMTMWRASVARGAEFRCVLLDKTSLQSVRILGLVGVVDFRLCPGATERPRWQDPQSEFQRCQDCLIGCRAGVDEAYSVNPIGELQES